MSHNLFLLFSEDLLESDTKLHLIFLFACRIPGMVFGKSIQLNKKKKKMVDIVFFNCHILKLNFLIDGIAIRLHVCSF